MIHSPYTLALNNKWDLSLDKTGKIKTLEQAEASSQNVSNEMRLFTKDAYFAQDSGIPHFMLELGAKNPPSSLRAALRKAALKVPEVKEILSVSLAIADSNKDRKKENTDGLKPRTLSGEINLTLKDSSHVKINI